MTLILAVNTLVIGLFGSYTTVPAAEFSAGAIAAGETLEWITAALAGAGISISVKELLKPRQADIEKDIGKHIDWDNWDWGDMLDSPAAQDQIDEAEKQLEKLYYGSTEAYKKYHQTNPTPTPAPTESPEPSPPVTVAPIDPDTVTPPDWDTLRKASMKNGYLLLGTATYWCLKEAAKGLWENIIGKYTDTLYDESYFEPLDGVDSHESFPKFAGSVYQEVRSSDIIDTYYMSVYVPKDAAYIIYKTNSSLATQYWYFYDDNDNPLNEFSYTRRILVKPNGNISMDYMLSNGSESGCFSTNLSGGNRSVIANFNLPIYIGSKSNENLDKSLKKPVIWPSTDLKDDYDNNKSPSLPETAPAPAIKIPSLDDVKDLQNRGNSANDDERPSIILDWLKNHYTNPSTDPNPKPDPDPNPDPKPDPDPNPDPNPNPDLDLDPNPTPTTAPKPDDTNTDVNPDDYKADLRLVFPFCIPFDLVHLIQAFEAEPEAPVFEFPFDLELENPWTGKKILDYHHVFKLDMSDYEPVIKIFRIFEIIFFIIGLLMITRQQMIKG